MKHLFKYTGIIIALGGGFGAPSAMAGPLARAFCDAAGSSRSPAVQRAYNEQFRDRCHNPAGLEQRIEFWAGANPRVVNSDPRVKRAVDNIKNPRGMDSGEAIRNFRRAR